MAAASFEFVQSTERLDWGVLVAIDLQRLIKDTNVDTLQRIVENLAFARVTRDEAAMFTPEHILHLFTLCQLVIQYLVNSQECLAKINVRLTERLQEMQHRGETAEAERERLHEENVVLRKEVKAQRRTLLAYEYANTTAAGAGGGGGMSTVGGGHLYVCPQCGDSYAKKESLQSHVRKRHGMVKKETSSFQPQQQQQQGNAVYESQAEQQRQLKEKVEKLESLLEREKERNDRIQRDSMMMMMQATMSGAARAPTPTSTTSAAPAAANTATPSFSSVSAPQQQQQTLQEPLARLPHVHSLPLQVSPEITAIPVMPDVAALQRYNTTRQQEAANNALLRKVSELEALVSDLKTTKKEATQTRAAPPPPPPEPTVPTTTTAAAAAAAAAVQAAALSSQTQQKPQEQQQSQPSRSSHTPSWLTAPGVAPPGPHVTPAAAPSLAMKPASVPSSSSVNAPQQPNQQQQQQAGVSAPLAAVTPPLSLPPPPPPPPPPPQPQQRQPQLPQPELQPQPQPQLPPQQSQPIKQESPQLAQAKPVPVPIPLSATAPGSSGSASTNFSYVSSHYNSVTKNTPLTAPSSSTQSVNVAPPNGKDASSSSASDTLLAKYGPPGPAIVPKSMPSPSPQQATKTETVSAQGSVPVWLPSNSHPDDSRRGSLNSSSIPQSNANPVPRTTDTTVAAPTLSPPRVQSNSLASADPYPTVQGTIPRDPQNVSQQQTAPPPMAVGLDPRLGGAPHSQHPVPVPLAPSYSTGVVMSAAGVPHAAVPVVRKFNADNGGSYFESSTSSDSS